MIVTAVDIDSNSKLTAAEIYEKNSTFTQTYAGNVLRHVEGLLSLLARNVRLPNVLNQSWVVAVYIHIDISEANAIKVQFKNIYFVASKWGTLTSAKKVVG